MHPDLNSDAPNAGSPEQGQAPISFDTKGNIGDDWRDVRRAGFWAWAAITLIATPALPTLLTVMTSEPRAGLSEAQVILQVFLLTFPLTLGVAIDAATLLLLAKYNALPDDRPRGEAPYNGQVMLFGGLTLVLALSASLGNWLGMGAGAVDLPKTEVKGHPLTWLNWLLGLLRNYFVLYGPQLFFSSLIVGVFAGWAAAMKLLPNLLSASLKQAEGRLRQKARGEAGAMPPPVAEAVRTAHTDLAGDHTPRGHSTAAYEQAAAAGGQAAAEDSNRLRQMLLSDIGNVALRKRYLAGRSSFQRWLDDGNGRRVRAMVAGAVVGLILGFTALAAATSKTSTNPAVAALDRATGGVGLPLIFGLLGFFSANYVLGRNAAYWEQQRLRGELGPLPADAKGDLVALRKHYLGE